MRGQAPSLARGSTRLPGSYNRSRDRPGGGVGTLLDEEAFLRSIAEESASAAATWLVLADWLEERGDPRAELVRLCHDPHCYPHLSSKQRDARIRALLGAG